MGVYLVYMVKGNDLLKRNLEYVVCRVLSEKEIPYSSGTNTFDLVYVVQVKVQQKPIVFTPPTSE